MSSCQYRDILGKPEEGVHSTRFLGVAINDVIGTIVGAYIITYFFYNKTFYESFYKVLTLLFILGVVLHRIFCVNTTVNKMIFGVV